MIRRRRKGWPTAPAEQVRPSTLEQRLHQEIYARDRDVLARASELVVKARDISNLKYHLECRDRRIADLESTIAAMGLAREAADREHVTDGGFAPSDPMVVGQREDGWNLYMAPGWPDGIPSAWAPRAGQTAATGGEES